MKWMAILLAVALFFGALYYVMTHGGALEMQPEHAAETAPKDHAGGAKK